MLSRYQSPTFIASKKVLDNGGRCSTLLLGLLKPSNCTVYNLLPAKLSTYDFDYILLKRFKLHKW